MTDGISADMIDTVQRHIYDALAQTSERSVLPEEGQDRLLAQACAEACDVLGRWLGSREWGELCPSGGGPIADAIPEWERIRPFLDPLKETLAAIARRQKDPPGAREIGDPGRYVDAVLKATAETARRFRRYDRQDLFKEATSRVTSLRAEVCALAGDLANDLESREKSAARRKKTRWVLAKIPGLLLTLSLAMAGANPHAMAQNIPAWGHDAVKMLVVHRVARTAQPGVKVAPPRLGPRVR
jgi:hypothetical protein